MTFMACAALLTSMIALNSCKSDEPGGNPNLNDGDVVKTEFAISLPDNVAGGPNKMPAASVINETSQFVGINDIILVPFAKQGRLTGTEVRLGKNIRLTPGVVKADLNYAAKAKVYDNVDIPLTTASFLFYGVSATEGTKFQVGSLKPDTASAQNNTANEFGFALEQINSSNVSTLLASGHGKSLLDYLSSVANAQDTMATGSKKWREYPNVGDSVAYYRMFKTYTSLEDLSSFQVERLLSDLYNSLNPVYESSAIAKGISKAINNPTYATIVNDSVKLIAALNNYPQELNLPAGCISIKWDGTSNAFIAGDYATNRATPDKFVYPAQLWFFANSTIKTSTVSLKSEYTTKTWEQILADHDDGLAVNTLTRAVALLDSVQFAAARLDVQVKLKDGISNLEDNSEQVEGVKKDVPIPAAGIPVTAVFVGGQKDVDFKFQPSGSTEYTIYDSVMNAAMNAKSGAYSAWNHTLVLETAPSIDIRIAVEMENNTGVDFYGAGGQLIPKNSKFYVVAQLEADDANETEDKIFKQDFTTKAKLSLNDLKKAYNTIPDLRTPKLEIGFAVDLSWQTGHEYTVDFE